MKGTFLNRQPSTFPVISVTAAILLSGAMLVGCGEGGAEPGLLVDPDGAGAEPSIARPGAPETERADAADDAGQIVSLSEARLAAAGIHVEPVEQGPLTEMHTVPGRVVYNSNRHLEIKTPTGGILMDVLVKPGDGVRAGQALAQLNSSEIGTARADVLERRAEVELLEHLLEHTTAIEQNAMALIEALKQQPDFAVLKEQFSARPLAEYRERLFGAYSRLLLARSVAEYSDSLAESGVLAGRMRRERESEARSALAALQATCEAAEVEVWEERSRSENAARDAARRLRIAREHLASLLLTPSATNAGSPLPDAAEMGTDDRSLEGLSLVAIRAPFAGTIESRFVAAGERVASGDSLFVLADTRSLWIEAEIRESDWPAVAMKAGQTVRLTAPALGDRPLSATVYFVGREVSTVTNSIPIVAQIDNAEGLLRPGLFVRVRVTLGTHSDVLSVPSSAVLWHDEQSFVFVREGDNRFRRIDVATGVQDGDRVEIVSGLRAGQPVVSDGSFLLKSELLLESEEE